MQISDSEVYANVAVKDQNAAKKFYGETLGLKQVDENPGGVVYQAGPSKLFVYTSPGTAGSGKATTCSFKVNDVKGAVEELKGKGISFEKYDLPGTTWEGDVSVMGPMQAAWFKDPDGNILCVANG